MYHCSICNATFPEQNDIISHLTSVHDTVKNFKTTKQNLIESFYPDEDAEYEKNSAKENLDNEHKYKYFTVDPEDEQVEQLDDDDDEPMMEQEKEETGKFEECLDFDFVSC